MAAARANWKGYLRLSLVSCPIALYPATSESEKIRFNQLNKHTGNRIRYSKVDAETGDEVEGDDIVKGYQVSKGQYLEITEEELDAVEIESTRTSALFREALLHRASRRRRPGGLRSDPRRA